MKLAPNLKKQPHDKMTEVIILRVAMPGRTRNNGRNRTGDLLATTCHLYGLETASLTNWQT